MLEIKTTEKQLESRALQYAGFSGCFMTGGIMMIATSFYSHIVESAEGMLPLGIGLICLSVYLKVTAYKCLAVAKEVAAYNKKINKDIGEQDE